MAQITREVFPACFLKKCPECRKLVRVLGEVFGVPRLDGIEVCQGCASRAVGVDIG